MKKILAIVLAFMFVLTALPLMASAQEPESPIPEMEFEVAVEPDPEGGYFYEWRIVLKGPVPNGGLTYGVDFCINGFPVGEGRYGTWSSGGTTRRGAYWNDEALTSVLFSVTTTDALGATEVLAADFIAGKLPDRADELADEADKIIDKIGEYLWGLMQYIKNLVEVLRRAIGLA